MKQVFTLLLLLGLYVCTLCLIRIFLCKGIPLLIFLFCLFQNFLHIFFFNPVICMFLLTLSHQDVLMQTDPMMNLPVWQRFPHQLLVVCRCSSSPGLWLKQNASHVPLATPLPVGIYQFSLAYATSKHLVFHRQMPLSRRHVPVVCHSHFIAICPLLAVFHFDYWQQALYQLMVGKKHRVSKASSGNVCGELQVPVEHE